ncbi:hypothetical protein HAX54_051148, partial [Datura stramonium]|nr:hypothetical protein [Datura stramonium]
WIHCSKNLTTTANDGRQCDESPADNDWKGRNKTLKHVLTMILVYVYDGVMELGRVLPMQYHCSGNLIAATVLSPSQ